ncbi:MAG: carboxypeptidase regulatory-like domain-containing protein [Candidatus Firestonebacteria bacterium]
MAKKVKISFTVFFIASFVLIISGILLFGKTGCSSNMGGGFGKAMNALKKNKRLVYIKELIAKKGGPLFYRIKGGELPKKETAKDYRKCVFKYENDHAKSVCITGEFNDWQLEPMKKKDGSKWAIMKFLPSDIDYAYQFMVDGNTVLDPDNINIIERGNRGKSSLLPSGVTDVYSEKAVTSSSSLYGRVLEKGKGPLANVTIKLSQGGLEILRVLTHNDGTYKINGLPLGKYEVKAWEQRHKPEIIIIEVNSCSARELNFLLSYK